MIRDFKKCSLWKRRKNNVMNHLLLTTERNYKLKVKKALKLLKHMKN